MTDTPPDEVVHDATTPTDATQASTPRRRNWRAGVPWAVALIALALASWSTWQWRQLAEYQGSIDAVRAAAVMFTQDLSNWDAGDGLEDEIATLRAQGTGPFLDEIDLVFGGDELTGQLRADEVSASGEVEEVFVQDLRGDLAEVFAVVSVTYASPDVQSELDPVTFPASLVLERVDGQWLVREVTIPNSSQIGQMLPPASEG